MKNMRNVVMVALYMAVFANIASVALCFEVNETLSPQQVSVQNGIDWLRSNQNANGSWLDDPAVTATAVTAMLNWNYSENDSVVSNGVEFVLSHLNDDGSMYNNSGRYTYYTAISVLAPAATHNPDYHDEMLKMREWLG